MGAGAGPDRHSNPNLASSILASATTRAGVGPHGFPKTNVGGSIPLGAANIAGFDALAACIPDPVLDMAKTDPMLAHIISEKTPMSVKLNRARDYLVDRRGFANRELGDLTDKLVRLEWEKSAVISYEGWCKTDKAVLQKNECSRFHKLIEAVEQGRCIFLNEKEKLESQILEDISDTWNTFKPFVIQNDWAAAFANATDYTEGKFNLPYERTTFELKINDRVVIVTATQTDDDVEYFCFVEAEGLWMGSDHFHSEADTFHPVGKLAARTIRAVCIALDAEVAIHNVVRAPEKLNRKRKETGKLPLFDYHVVSLANRHRVEPANLSGTHKSPRLHFRRGHWRHYENFKTWIKWTLVGNPDLGFIDKHYTL